MENEEMTYECLRDQISSIEDYPLVIQKARNAHKQYLVGETTHKVPYIKDETPFNLEREYFDLLLDEDRVKEARIILERMERTYNVGWHNLLEQQRYRFKLVVETNYLVEKKIKEAEKEFNKHTLLVLSIVVGVITIFGSANQFLHASSYKEALMTFTAIIIAIALFISVVYIFNSRQR